MTAHGLTCCAERCWAVAAVDDRGEAHYPSCDKAEAFRESCGPSTAAVRQLPAPCWLLACAECREPYEDDEVGCVHFVCPTEAEVVADAAGWRLVDGRWLCPDCFGAAEPDVRSAVAWSSPLVAPLDHPALIALRDVPTPPARRAPS